MRNAWAFHRARGAMCIDTQIGTHGALCRGTGQPYTLAVHGVCVLAEHTVPGALIAKDPRDGHESRYFALRSARGWTLRLAACPQELSLLSTRRLVRTDCRPDMHLDRPPDAPASIAFVSAAPGRSIRNPRVLKARHRSGHRIPLPRRDDDRDAPLTGAGWRKLIPSNRPCQASQEKNLSTF